MNQLEVQTTEYKVSFATFDMSIKERLKCKDHTYGGAKPHPEDWVELLEFDSDFNDEFNKIYDNKNIPEADDHTPGIIGYIP